MAWCLVYSRCSIHNTFVINIHKWLIPIHLLKPHISFHPLRSWDSDWDQNFSHVPSPVINVLYALSSLLPTEILSSFSRSVVSDSSRPHESQHARPPCPSPTPRVHSDSGHWVSDAIQPSHPLSSPSPPAPNPSQHQSLFQWLNSLHEVAKVLEFQL